MSSVLLSSFNSGIGNLISWPSIWGFKPNSDFLIAASIKHRISFLTLFAFSTENWKRPKKEINYLFGLLESFLKNRIEDLHKQNIKLKILGSKKFSLKLNKLLNNSEKKTSNNTKLQINLALNYGSKSELIEAFKRIQKKKVP